MKVKLIIAILVVIALAYLGLGLFLAWLTRDDYANLIED